MYRNNSLSNNTILKNSVDITGNKLSLSRHLTKQLQSIDQHNEKLNNKFSKASIGKKLKNNKSKKSKAMTQSID